MKTNNASSGSNGSTHVKIQGSERPALPGAMATGPVDPHEWIEGTLKLRRAAPLPELAGRPKKTLTHDELTSKYGASNADIEKVSSMLEHYGVSVRSVHRGARTVHFAGPADAVESLFQVRLLHYSHKDGNYRGRTGSVQVPNEIAGVVTGVFGLDTRRVVKRRGGLKSATLASPSTPASQRSWFFPAELAAIYNYPNGDGQGQCIGLIELGGGYFPADLKEFCSQANVPVPEVIPVSVEGAPTNARDGAEGEVMLDIEVVAGVCPKAKIVVYFSKWDEQGWINVIDAAVHDKQNNPSVLSISWGIAEDLQGGFSMAALSAINETLKEAAMLGMTVCVAAGDDGSSDADFNGKAHADFPPTSPYVLAVGGTSVRRAKGKINEVAWKDGDGIRPVNGGNGGSTGGGVSAIFPRPSWQQSVNIQNINPGEMNGRVVPDVAADASGKTGYWWVSDGQAAPNGGTSAATPLWASLILLLNASLGNGKRVGYLTPLLYQKSSNGTIGSIGCKDITTGNNDTAAVGGYKAGVGFDAVTGWGSPQGQKLLAALKSLI